MSERTVPRIPSIAVRRFIAYDKCIGCLSCQEICAFLYDGLNHIELYEVERGLRKPISCFHCAKAPCVTVCPTGALTYDKEGAVVLRIAKCIGCTSCVIACPFGIPVLLPVGHVVKCDLCAKLRLEGLEPGCIAVCPTNAIVWTSPESLIRRAREKTLARLVEAYSTSLGY